MGFFSFLYVFAGDSSLKKIVLDVENTTTKLGETGKLDYSPYNSNNKLCSIGWMVMEDNKLSPVNYIFVYHNELEKIDTELLQKFKDDLASAQVVIAHNAKFDLAWLIEAGFNADHLNISDTMIAEFVMARGRKGLSYSLKETCLRYKGVSHKADSIFEKYPDLMFNEMPIAECEDYGRADIQACAELYLAQYERIHRSDYVGLIKTVVMMNEFCKILVDMERNGVQIDVKALAEVKHQFTMESDKLRAELGPMVRKLMGDTPLNLDSPQQLSELIYSRRIKEGSHEDWVTTFNIGKDIRGKFKKRPKMNYTEYSGHVLRMTQVVLKTEVHQCQNCKGTGKIQRIKKDGNPWNKPTKCKPCEGSGAIYTDLNQIAGLKMKPKNIYFTTMDGFSTGKTFLEELKDSAQDENNQEAVEFLRRIVRLNAVSTYLSSFVEGIASHLQQDTLILHPNFNQTIAITGRLSSSSPNMQNMPREKTFPIRKVFKSRWEGGSLVEVDYAQLEFRAAGHLSRDPNILRDVLAKIDVHNQTMQILHDAGQEEDRQSSKPHTFKPLYGGRTGTKAEQKYYTDFLTVLYPRTGGWHKELQEEAIAKLMITLPTGRQYIFPDVKRNYYGGATNATQIVNYPVQGFATADLVQIGIIRVAKEFKKANLKSLLILTVHDSLVADCYPGEEEQVIGIMSKIAKYTEEEAKLRYGIDMYVPLDNEVKIGYNLMESKKVA